MVEAVSLHVVLLQTDNGPRTRETGVSTSTIEHARAVLAREPGCAFDAALLDRTTVVVVRERVRTVCAGPDSLGAQGWLFGRTAAVPEETDAFGIFELGNARIVRATLLAREEERISRTAAIFRFGGWAAADAVLAASLELLVAEVVPAGGPLRRTAVAEILVGAAFLAAGGTAIPQARAAAAAHALSVGARLTGSALLAAAAAVIRAGLGFDARLAALDLGFFALLLLGVGIIAAEQGGQRRSAREAQKRPPRRRGDTLGDVVESGMIHAAPPGWPRTVELDASTTSYDHAKMAGRHFNTYRP
jgi:hypothetical protein